MTVVVPLMFGVAVGVLVYVAINWTTAFVQAYRSDV